jgi:hypothetical protein
MRAPEVPMQPSLLLARSLLFVLALGLMTGVGACGPRPIQFAAPLAGQLSLAAVPMSFELALPEDATLAQLALTLDGAPVAPPDLAQSGARVTGTLAGLAPGWHELAASVAAQGASFAGSVQFEIAALQNPDECDVLNDVACTLPFPSSRFLVPASTRTGFRVELPAQQHLPQFGGFASDPAHFLRNDGFSPTAQVLMHFPGGVDLAQSNAARIDAGSRTYGTRGLDADSPTLLIDWETGERVNHWLENDSRARSAARVLTFLRPGESLVPGHRYVVAVRRLVNASGAPVAAEPAFAAIRDRRPSTIAAVRKRAAQLEPVFARLERIGVERSELILAFDFVVMSDQSLAGDMLNMRRDAFRWLDEQLAAGAQPFAVTSVVDVNPGCADPAVAVWRRIEGTFSVPLFLSGDPFSAASVPSFLTRSADGAPSAQGFTQAPFGAAIPCAAFRSEAALPGLVIGHGLFGTGVSTVSSLTASRGLTNFDFVSVATNWSGLSGPDVAGPLDQTFIFQLIVDPSLFPALPDRLRQGQLNTLVLARLLARGAFNGHAAFQLPSGGGAIDTGVKPYYFGASLGGIMGTMFGALSPDVEKLNVDVPAINFSLLLHRATPFIQFEQLITLLNRDALDQSLGLALQHELWVRGEPAGYATHVTSNPFPDTNAKQVLATVALYDHQVANLGSQLLGRTLRLGTLEGSVMRGLAGQPDLTGPQDSGYVVYSTGSFDPANPLHAPFIPPLFNDQVQTSKCDPHGRRGFIPASVEQLRAWFTPGGKLENFCSDDGVCNASAANEWPNGVAPCDPLL